MGKFRIKITPWWASDDWAQFKYSTNGLFWKRIYSSEYNILDERYYMTPLTTHYSSSESTMLQFNSIEDVRKYETEQSAIVNRENARIREYERQEEVKKNAFYKRFG